MTEMTASYSEISFDSQPSPVNWSVFDDQMIATSRPDTLDLGSGLNDIEDTEQGKLFSFVAEDLENQIKLASPVSRKG